MKKNILIGISGGIALFVPYFVVSLLPYLELQAPSTPLVFLIAIGGVITAMDLLLKERSPKNATLRFFIMVVSCFIITRFFAIIGITSHIRSVFQIQENEADDRVAGLGMAYFLMIISAEWLLITMLLLLSNARKARLTPEK